MAAKGYIIARVAVRDPDAYAAYAGAATKVIAAHGGRVLARGGDWVGLEGDARPRNVIIEFPSFEAALTYWRSEAYQDARALRAGAADIDLVAVAGADTP